MPCKARDTSSEYTMYSQSLIVFSPADMCIHIKYSFFYQTSFPDAEEQRERSTSRLTTRLCKKIGLFKRFNFQKERFLMPEKRFFYCMHT